MLITSLALNYMMFFGWYWTGYTYTYALSIYIIMQLVHSQQLVHNKYIIILLQPKHYQKLDKSETAATISHVDESNEDLCLLEDEPSYLGDEEYLENQENTLSDSSLDDLDDSFYGDNNITTEVSLEMNNMETQALSDNEKPIYLNARITNAVSILLIMTYAVTHKLSGEALKDLLSLIDIHCLVPHALIQSLQFLQV